MRIEKDVIDRCAGKITRNIIAGIYKPGAELPPIGRLAQVYGVHRAVVEAALRELCVKGTIYRAENHTDARQKFKVAGESPASSGGFNVLTEKYLTVTEVAAVLRVSKVTVYRLVRDKEIESKRIGRSFRILERSLSDYLLRCDDF